MGGQSSRDSAASSVKRSTVAATDGSELLFTVNQVYSRDHTLSEPKPFSGFACWMGEENANGFPVSMEYITLPLSELMSGLYDFNFEKKLDPLLEAAAAKGRHCILRVTLDTPGKPSGVPPFLLGSGFKSQSRILSFNKYREHGGGMSPNYNHKVLIDACVLFIEALGKRYDADIRLPIVQAGLLGFWGEWHCFPHDNFMANNIVQQRIIDAYRDSFKQTYIQYRMPVLNTPEIRNAGYHDDMFPTDTLSDDSNNFLPRLWDEEAGRQWHTAPIGGEVDPTCQKEAFSDNPPECIKPERWSQAVKEAHAAWMLCNYPFSNPHRSLLDRTKKAANELGYALFVSGVRCFAVPVRVLRSGSTTASFISLTHSTSNSKSEAKNGGMCACGLGGKRNVPVSTGPSPKSSPIPASLPLSASRSRSRTLNPPRIDYLRLEVKIGNAGVAPFYQPLFLEYGDTKGEMKKTMDEDLALLLPGKSILLHATLDYDAVQHFLDSETMTFSVRLRLTSPHLLEGQKIQLYNIGSDLDGFLDVSQTVGFDVSRMIEDVD